MDITRFRPGGASGGQNTSLHSGASTLLECDSHRSSAKQYRMLIDRRRQYLPGKDPVDNILEFGKVRGFRYIFHDR